MGKKLLVFLFILGLVFSLPGVWSRYKAEQLNRGVDLVLDYNSLQTLVKEQDLPNEEVLRRLKDSGLNSIALYPVLIKDLLNQGRVRLYTGNEIMRTQEQIGSLAPLFVDFPFDNNSVFIKIKDADLVPRTLAFLPIWTGKYKFDYKLYQGQLILFFKKWDVKYLNLSLGLDPQLVKEIAGLGLGLVPRLENNKLDNQLNWSILRDYRPEYVIFSGGEVTGYNPKPARCELGETATIMREHDILFGMIEANIAQQKGAATLARELDYQLLRVHSIQQGEMDSSRDKYSIEGIVERYLRSVRERNVRILYLKPFLRDKQGQPPLESTEKYIRLLTSRLKDEGYLPGELSPYPKYQNSHFDLIMISLGISAAGLLLLSYLLGNGLRKWLFNYYWVLILLVLIVGLVLIFTDRVFLLRKMLALASSVIFPSLAIISQLLSGRVKNWLKRFGQAALISLSGAILLMGSLSHLSFSLKVDQFTGVKLSMLLPLILITLYYSKSFWTRKDYHWRQQFSNFLELNLKVKHLLLIGIIGLAGAFYIGRTGNNPVLPVPDLEILLRSWLERVLYIRPRFKEFLIGHPLLIIGLKLVNSWKERIIFYPVLLLAAVGQINILNTFSHVHTPLSVSLLRVIHGLWLGIIVGILFWMLLSFMAKLWPGRQT